MDGIKEDHPDAMQGVQYDSTSSFTPGKFNLGERIDVTVSSNRSSTTGTSAAVGLMAPSCPMESPPRSTTPRGSPTKYSPSGKQVGLKQLSKGSPSHSTSGKHFTGPNSMAAQFPMVLPTGRRSPVAGKRLPGTLPAQFPMRSESPDIVVGRGLEPPRSVSGKQIPLTGMMSSGRVNNTPVDRSKLPSPSRAPVAPMIPNTSSGSTPSSSTTEPATSAPTTKKTVKFVKPYQPPTDNNTTMAPKKTGASKKAAAHKKTAAPKKAAAPKTATSGRSNPNKTPKATSTASGALTTGHNTPTKKATPQVTTDPESSASGSSTPTTKSPATAFGQKKKATPSTTSDEFSGPARATTTSGVIFATTTMSSSAASSTTSEASKKKKAAPKKKAFKKGKEKATELAAEEESGEKHGVKAQFDGRILRVIGLPNVFANAPPSSPDRLNRPFPFPFENRDMLNPIPNNHFDYMKQQSFANPVGYWAAPLFHSTREIAEHLEGLPGPHTTILRPELHGIFADPDSTDGILPGYSIRPLNCPGASAVRSGISASDPAASIYRPSLSSPQIVVGDSSKTRIPPSEQFYQRAPSSNSCAQHSPISQSHGSAQQSFQSKTAARDSPGIWRPADPEEAFNETLDNAAFACFERDLLTRPNLRAQFLTNKYNDPDNKYHRLSFWMDMDEYNQGPWFAEVKMKEMLCQRDENAFAVGFKAGQQSQREQQLCQQQQQQGNSINRAAGGLILRAACDYAEERQQDQAELDALFAAGVASGPQLHDQEEDQEEDHE